MILVEFFASWCNNCKRFAPIYQNISEELSQGLPKVAVAKIDGYIHKKIADRFGVKHIPTLFWFNNGVPEKYMGEKT